MSLPDASLPRPYPPDVYTGDDGEVSAWVRRSDAGGDVPYRNGVRCEYLATGEQTAGRFGLYRWTFGEGESGPDPHFHRSISEHFYVLSGTVRLGLGERELLVEAGQAASFDTMTPHVIGAHGGPAELLSIFDRHGEAAHLRP